MRNKFIVILCFVCLLTLTGCNDNKIEEVKKEDKVILKENLDIEVNSELNLLSLISKDNKVTITSEDVKIDTSKIGQKELTLKYKVDNEDKEYTFKINIVDKEAPIIKYKETLSTTEGKKIDLLKGVSAADNSKEEIKVKVDGEYNYKKAGEYKLKYVATDSSGNKTEKDFVLKVNKKKVNNSNQNNNTSISNQNNNINNTNQNDNTSTSNQNNNISNTNQNNNTSNQNNNNNSPVCDQDWLDNELRLYNNAISKINIAIDKYEDSKNEAQALFNRYGGYITQEDYNSLYSSDLSSYDKTVLMARNKASRIYDDCIENINNFTEQKRSIEETHQQRLKDNNC